MSIDKIDQIVGGSPTALHTTDNVRLATWIVNAPKGGGTTVVDDL
jgi:hypothetical protein